MLYTPAFWAMALANLCHTASFSAFFLLPLYVLEQGGSRGDVGLVMGIFSMASAVCRPWVSSMIDRIGRKRSYTLGSIMMVIPPLLYIGLNDPLGAYYPMFIMLRLLHGVGLAICFTAVFTFMADILPQGRLNEGIGMFGISGLLGIALGPVLAEATLTGYGFTGLFLVAGALSGTAFLVHQPLRESHTRHPPTAQGHVSFFRLLRREKFIVVGLLALMFGVGLAATGSFVAPLAEARGLGYISVYFFCYSGGAIAIRFVGGKLADEVGERAILPYGIGLYIVGIFMLPFTYSPLVLCGAGTLSGIGHGLLFPLLNTMAVRDEPGDLRGKATGIFTGGIDAGIFAGSLILGYIGEWFGLNVLFFCAGLCMTTALIIFRFRGTNSTAGSRQPP